MNTKIIPAILLIMLVISISYIALDTINDNHQTELEQLYLKGRYDTLFSIGQQLQQTGTVIISIPIYEDATNTTAMYNVELELVQ